MTMERREVVKEGDEGRKGGRKAGGERKAGMKGRKEGRKEERNAFDLPCHSR